MDRVATYRIRAGGVVRLAEGMAFAEPDLPADADEARRAFTARELRDRFLERVHRLAPGEGTVWVYWGDGDKLTHVTDVRWRAQLTIWIPVTPENADAALPRDVLAQSRAFYSGGWVGVLSPGRHLYGPCNGPIRLDRFVTQAVADGMEVQIKGKLMPLEMAERACGGEGRITFRFRLKRLHPGTVLWNRLNRSPVGRRGGSD